MKAGEKKLDDLWKRLVKERAEYRCQKCNSKGAGHPLEAHHVYRRECRGTRFHALNGVCLCRKCHAEQRRRPAVFLDWYEEIIGENALADLSFLSRTITKRNEQDLEELYAELPNLFDLSKDLVV